MNSFVFEEKLNLLSVFEGWGWINVIIVNSMEGNIMVFFVWFCFVDLWGVEVLNGMVYNN